MTTTMSIVVMSMLAPPSASLMGWRTPTRTQRTGLPQVCLRELDLQGCCRTRKWWQMHRSTPDGGLPPKHSPRPGRLV